MAYGLVGRNIEYSFSKEIHESFGGYEYSLFSLEPEAFDAFMQESSFDGLNITIPYKKDVMKYCDRISSLAEKIGAVNTVYRAGEDLVGTNTDYDGFSYLVDKTDISLEGKKVLILGSGGAMATVLHVCLERKASEILIASRNPKDASRRMTFISEGIRFCSYPDIPGDCQIVINTTPVGTHPDSAASPLDLLTLPDCEGVLDLVYNPPRTKLICQAIDLGIPCSSGLAMLVAQAVRARDYFLQGDAAAKPYDLIKLDETCAPLIAKLGNAKNNIVLIGMPGSGKTTLGKALAEEMGRIFIDCDEYIEKKVGKSPAQIIAEEGEKAFRAVESACILDFAGEDSLVIATGGGVITREENMEALRRKGIFVFIDTPLEKLATEGRPLSKGGNALEELYKKRVPLYRRWANLTVADFKDLDKAAEKVRALFG